MLLLRRKFANILKFNTRTNWIPVLAVATPALLSLASGFSGLYGQDAHEYLRLSRAFYDQIHGAAPAASYAELAPGYPILAALLRSFSGLDAVLCLQIVSWLSAGLALWFFDALLRQTAPGAYASSRYVCAALLLGLAPFFVRAGFTVMSDAAGLALTLATLLNGLRAMEDSRGRHALSAALLGAAAVWVRFSSLALLFPLACAVAWALAARGRWFMLAGSVVLTLCGLWPLYGYQTAAGGGFAGHSMFQDWSVLNLFQRSFDTLNGTQRYWFPNLLYGLSYPLLFPGFFLLLPALFMLFKRTDLHLPVKKVILACIAAHVLLLTTAAGQNPRHLLPDYALVLLLMFPAWDRFFAYGFYFFKRLITALLSLGLVVQLGFIGWFMYPVVQRARLEKNTATVLRALVPPGAAIYGFDLDIALKSWMPVVRIYGLWEKRYTDFEPGAYVLFNEKAARPQWEGKNPVLNWEYLQEHDALEKVADLKNGWILYKIVM